MKGGNATLSSSSFVWNPQAPVFEPSTTSSRQQRQRQRPANPKERRRKRKSRQKKYAKNGEPSYKLNTVDFPTLSTGNINKGLDTNHVSDAPSYADQLVVSQETCRPQPIKSIPVANEEKEESWPSSLVRLSNLRASSRTKDIKKDHIPVPPESNKDASIPVIVEPNAFPKQGGPPLWKNMERLRDRLWKQLDERDQRQAFWKELAQVMVHRRVPGILYKHHYPEPTRARRSDQNLAVERQGVLLSRPIHVEECRPSNVHKQVAPQEVSPDSLLDAAKNGDVSTLMQGLDREESLPLRAKDAHVNNLLHTVVSSPQGCSTQKDDDCFHLVWDFLVQNPKEYSKPKRKKKHANQSLVKLFLQTNNHGQTPMHVACQAGHLVAVETFLNKVPTQTLIKALGMKDDWQQTPLLASIAAGHSSIVLSLIHWNGGTATRTSDDKGTCPLTYAARLGHVEIMELLLEFQLDESQYSPTHALHASLESYHATKDDAIVMECISLLVSTGANVFESLSAQDDDDDDEGPVSALLVAVRHKLSVVALHRLYHAGKQRLDAQQDLRRKDPTLRLQPEVFFTSREAKENKQRHIAESEALCYALFEASSQKEMEEDHYWRVAKALYEWNVCLDPQEVQWLHRMAVEQRWLRQDQLPSAPATESCSLPQNTGSQKAKSFLVTSYDHYGYLGRPSGPLDHYGLSYWSERLMSFEWMQACWGKSSSRCQCNFMDHHQWASHTITDDVADGTVSLRTVDGAIFHADADLVSSKSAKLAAAIRFARQQDAEGPLCIDCSLDSSLCQLLMMHIHHGSILCGWHPTSAQANLELLMNLLWVSQEFLCPSLAQECELRLLSKTRVDNVCFCWACARSTKESSCEETDGHVNLPAARVTCEMSIVSNDSLVSEFPLQTMSVLQQLDGQISGYSMEYSGSTFSPLSLSWHCAIKAMLMNFGCVMRDSFYTQSALQASEDQQPDGVLAREQYPILLLRLCMEELSTMPLI